MIDSHKIGLVGLGTVGTGACEILTSAARQLKVQTSLTFEVVTPVVADC
ncbi:hypothetical protein [Secundilactobacillus kimchicus]|nr:hypothetical protein [Secundilactobacillus kimchicus]MBT9671038.1 hypothetical protein [Secundilactobacillus kimchicus]